MNGIQLKEITQPDAWDRFVLGHKDSCYTHLFNWARVLQDAYRCRSIYLAGVGGDEEICGILPLYRFKRFWGRPALVSIPFFDTAGILAGDAKTAARLFKRSVQLFSGQRMSGLELRQNTRLGIQGMILPGIPADVYTHKVGLHLDLSGSQQEMIAGFKSKLRSQIRKAEKNGLTWTIGKEELLDSFYHVFSRNMRDLGSPVHSKKFFNAVFTHFYHQAFICVVYYGSTPTAASFMFRFKNRLANPWASSIREFRSLNSNMFLYWQMIRFACNMGLEVFDMGRSSKGAATYRFKRQWGPTETQLFWYRWFCGENRRDSETLTVGFWKRLPITIANLIGPGIRKNISL